VGDRPVREPVLNRNVGTPFIAPEGNDHAEI